MTNRVIVGNCRVLGLEAITYGGRPSAVICSFLPLRVSETGKVGSKDMDICKLECMSYTYMTRITQFDDLILDLEIPMLPVIGNRPVRETA